MTLGERVCLRLSEKITPLADPVILRLPETSNFAPGVVVPMPTLPLFATYTPSLSPSPDSQWPLSLRLALAVNWPVVILLALKFGIRAAFNVPWERLFAFRLVNLAPSPSKVLAVTCPLTSNLAGCLSVPTTLTLSATR